MLTLQVSIGPAPRFLLFERIPRGIHIEILGLAPGDMAWQTKVQP